jgi:pyrimidine deaminase RibD-like protein
VSDEDARWMSLAAQLAALSPPSPGAYSVGAVIVAAEGTEVARGFSREGGDLHVHAEESALGKVSPDDPRCTELILATGIRRVVIAWREPSLFVADCVGVELLERAGVEVTELPGFAAAAKAPNRHLGAW